MLEGFPLTLEDLQRTTALVAKLLDGKQEARVSAMRLNPPPQSYGTGRCAYWREASST